MTKIFNILKKTVQACINASIIMGLIGIMVLGACVMVWHVTQAFDVANPVWERLMYGFFFVCSMYLGFTSKLTYNYTPNEKAKVEIE